MSIKSFIYLDQYKMYSISSQIFEGLTEHITSFVSQKQEESENQKGPLASGRIMANILSTESTLHETKFLHDHSYTLFEQKLLSDNVVALIDQNTINDNVKVVDEKSFIKVTGRLVFNDIAIIKSTLNDYNNLASAIVYVTNLETVMDIKNKHEKAQGGQSGRNNNNRRDPAKAMQAELSGTLASLAADSNLSQDQEFLDKLAYLFSYGFHDQFEVQMRILNNEGGVKLFSANLNREYIKENEHLLIRKYARYTEKDFTIFGVVTQSGLQKNDDPSGDDSDDTVNIKSSLQNMVAAISGVEANFTGRQENETVIDPIAIYREL